MGCGCQGQQAISPAERLQQKQARRNARMDARAARTVTDTSAPSRFWNGPKGKSAS